MQPEEDASSYLYGSTNYLAPNLAEVDQDGIAQWLALWLATEEVLGSNSTREIIYEFLTKRIFNLFQFEYHYSVGL